MRYDVHLFPVIHLPLGPVEADSPQQAIEAALEQADLYAACLQAGHEFNEDIVGYLVDEVGQDDAVESHGFPDPHHISSRLRELPPALESGSADPPPLRPS